MVNCFLVQLNYSWLFENYKAILSDDRKTAKLVPQPSFNLGQTFTLFIKPNSRFDGKKLLNREVIYHFKTIDYKGV